MHASLVWRPAEEDLPFLFPTCLKIFLKHGDAILFSIVSASPFLSSPFFFGFFCIYSLSGVYLFFSLAINCLFASEVFAPRVFSPHTMMSLTLRVLTPDQQRQSDHCIGTHLFPLFVLFCFVFMSTAICPFFHFPVDSFYSFAVCLFFMFLLFLSVLLSAQS